MNQRAHRYASVTALIALCMGVLGCQPHNSDQRTDSAKTVDSSRTASQIPEAVMDRCLLFEATRNSAPSPISFFVADGIAQPDDTSVPGYRVFAPEFNKDFGYAVSKTGKDDYIFIGTNHGDIQRATPVNGHQPDRLTQPEQTSYGVLHMGERDYGCVMAELDRNHASFMRAAWVGEIPASKGMPLILFYKVADVSKLEGFKDPDKDGVPVGIIGIDHLADHLSVQNFTVNDGPSNRAGGGSGLVCCMTLPRQWRPDLTVKVQWNVTNWRDCKGEEHEAIVPVERYDEVGNLWVHFLADGRVRVVSSNYGAAAANVPGSLHPVKDPIPNKHPWDIWDLDNDCRPYDKDHPKKWTLP